ncbi:MAG: SWIM zinc finger family protein [Dehalococcoidales bacterium]|jgi:hypothetical protein|nr:SWIM zinc finger family protein [Dehalococcoidales bacterium]MDD4230039.1 SWIM zinc finger family protein [Dehalococcoidales bacterium]MDD4465371.1 SWIM zinc finger family protein [Dehalococcoidales bacterium]MDD5401984.1 SWIM zinc finger family protein [Dehalococcoidales bacterium]
MQSSLIGKVEKAKLYAREPERITFSDFSVTIRGDNHDHITSYKNGRWTCNCPFFESREWCSHTMAMQKILGVMLPEDARNQEIEED